MVKWGPGGAGASCLEAVGQGGVGSAREPWREQRSCDPGWRAELDVIPILISSVIRVAHISALALQVSTLQATGAEALDCWRARVGCKALGTVMHRVAFASPHIIVCLHGRVSFIIGTSHSWPSGHAIRGCKDSELGPDVPHCWYMFFA